MNIMDYLPKLILASIIGQIIGWERSSRRYSQIGIGTTSILVTGATLLTIISKYGLSSADPSRLIANIITAVGFLCGSVIFMKPNDEDEDNGEVALKGLTTSVTLFNATAIGIAIGLGHYELAIVATLVLEFNILMSRLRKRNRNTKE